MADRNIYELTTPEAIDYFTRTYGQLAPRDAASPLMTEEEAANTTPFLAPKLGDYQGGLTPTEYGYEARLTPAYDPHYGETKDVGGMYGYWVGEYDPTGKLINLRQEKAQRSGGWFEENADWVLPAAFALIAGPAVLGAAGGGGAAGAGAGAGTVAGSGLGALEAAAAYDAALAGVGANVGTGTITGAGLGALDAAAAYDAALTGVGSNVGTGAVTGTGLGALDAAAAYDAGLTGVGSNVGGAGTSAGAAGAGISEGTMAGLETAVGEAGAATAPQLSTLESAKEFLKTLGVKDLKTALQMGLLGSGLIDYLTRKNASGPGAQGMQLRTPMTFKRTRNTQAAPTAADARAYLQGQPGTSSAQRSYFNQGFTRGQTYDARTGETYVRDPNTGRLVSQSALDEASRQAGLASGGLAALAAGGGVDGHLGGYSDGGRLLRGPGDGVSDSIPATIAGKQPARLADGEFVIPARIVSELGNGSTEAGARKLYKMMDRIQRGRRKTVGKNAVAKDSKAEKHLPA